jgi:hypothetical protein
MRKCNMSRFLKLTNSIINLNYIYKIDITPTKYYIYIDSKELDGNSINFCGSGWGNISKRLTIFQICETNDPIDYKKVTHWINKI